MEEDELKRTLEQIDKMEKLLEEVLAGLIEKLPEEVLEEVLAELKEFRSSETPAVGIQGSVKEVVKELLSLRKVIGYEEV